MESPGSGPHVQNMVNIGPARCGTTVVKELRLWCTTYPPMVHFEKNIKNEVRILGFLSKKVIS